MFKRILMNQADASPGNGAVVPPAPVAEPPQAQGATPTPNPLEDTVARLASQVESVVKAMNSLHAEGRRSREGKSQPKQDTNADTTPTADDPSSLLALRDAFDDATSELKLAKTQRQLLREHVMGKRPHPSDVDGVVLDYVSRAGWTAQPVNNAPPDNAPAQPAPKPQNAQPVSDRGAPPAPRVPLEEMDLVTMSDSDRNALIREKGLPWYRKKLASQLKGRPVQLRR